MQANAECGTNGEKVNEMNVSSVSTRDTDELLKRRCDDAVVAELSAIAWMADVVPQLIRYHFDGRHESCVGVQQLLQSGVVGAVRHAVQARLHGLLQLGCYKACYVVGVPSGTDNERWNFS